MSDVEAGVYQMRLTKHRAVVVRQDMPFEVWFQSEEDPYLPELRISNQIWEDMGFPETVTITVEPGDRLEDA